MSNLLLLPLDGRPCNGRFPVELAALGGHQLLTPPPDALGDARQPARLGVLDAWLNQYLPTSQKLFLSLDTWLYGNLVASRRSPLSREQVLQRLQGLRDWKQRFPALSIYGFATLLRVSNSNDATEERPYWATYGQQIYRLSWLEHRLSLCPELQAEQAEYVHLQNRIPAEVLCDYRSLRQRNFSVLQALIALVDEGILSQLLIGCDDGGEYGWTVQERQQLEAQVQQAELSRRCLIYPGADELACVLLARVLVPDVPRFALAWTYPEAIDLPTRYEGRALSETLAIQAQATGVEWVATDAQTSESLALIWIHNPPAAPQSDQFLERAHRVALAPERLQGLQAALAAGQAVALADLCYANGGDAALLQDLEEQQLLLKLLAYAAWNTNGNSLGLLLAWLKFLSPFLSTEQSLPARHWRFLLERLADDGWYQGYLRQQLCADYREPVTLQSCLSAIHWFNQHFESWQALLPAEHQQVQVQRLTFPWKRFFEVDLQLCMPSDVRSA